MKELNEKISEKPIRTSIDGIDAKIIYHIYKGFSLNTLLISFGEKRRVLSTLEGYKEVPCIANTYTPLPLSQQVMKNFREFKRNFPVALGLAPKLLSFISTGVNMDELAVCEQSYEKVKVCCFATAGVGGNALRTGVDVASFVERPGQFLNSVGTINVLLLTNVTLSAGAMARAIITITEAKTAALQDLNVRSTSSPQNQATGTGTDNIIIASGKMGKPLLLTSGHAKTGELIGFATKTAVTEALRKHDGR
jgi:adenosylcobinamide amidohydrolase